MNAKFLIPLILPLGLALGACGGSGSTDTSSPTQDAAGGNHGSGNNGNGNGNGNGGSTDGGTTDGGSTGDGGTPGGDTTDSSDKTAPTVVGTVPESGSTYVGGSGSISVEFSESIDPASVSAESVVLSGPSGNVTVETSVNDARLTLMPQQSLDAGKSYSVTVKSAVRDLSGNLLGTDYSWQFTIGKDTCAGFYADNFVLTEGKDTTAPKSGFAKPAKGARYADPAYRTCVVRATDHEAEGVPGFARNDYARHEPFNADESHYLVFAHDGNWHIYRTDDLSHVRMIKLGGGSTEPQWHPTNPDLLYVFNNHGVGMTISTFNVKTGERKVVADMHNVKSIAGRPGVTDLTAIWPNAYRAWTKSEGSPSADARYWAMQVETQDFQSIGMITYDLQENVITGIFDFAKDGNGIGRPDHISMSPTGQFVVPSWNGSGVNCASATALGTRSNPCGLMAYSRDFSRAVGLTIRGPHSDIGLDANGRDVIVAGDYSTGWVQMWDLETGQMTRLWQIYADGNGTAMHISAKNFNKPGWALISTYATKQPGWYYRKIMAVEMKANPRILNIAHSYNLVETYFSETHAAVNRDFTRVLFNSNWNTGNMLNIDAYMITLPSDAVPAVN